MEKALSDKNILLISIGSIALFALFTFASYIGFQSLSEVFEVNEVKQVLGEAVNIGSSGEENMEELSQGMEKEVLVQDYKIMQGKELGKLGDSDHYSFYLSWPVSRGLGVVTQCLNDDHTGIDIAHYSYPDILAAAPGEVIFTGCDPGECPEDGNITGGSGLGRKIMIEHNYGFITVYGHLNNIYVKKGDTVRRGQIIGQMGQSGLIKGLNGNEGGVHVHFSLIEDEDWKSIINPADYMLRAVCLDGEPDKEAFY